MYTGQNNTQLKPTKCRLTNRLTRADIRIVLQPVMKWQTWTNVRWCPDIRESWDSHHCGCPKWLHYRYFNVMRVKCQGTSLKVVLFSGNNNSAQLTLVLYVNGWRCMMSWLYYCVHNSPFYKNRVYYTEGSFWWIQWRVLLVSFCLNTHFI
jgi:hypothetical protein